MAYGEMGQDAFLDQFLFKVQKTQNEVRDASLYEVITNFAVLFNNVKKLQYWYSEASLK